MCLNGYCSLLSSSQLKSITKAIITHHSTSAIMSTAQIRRWGPIAEMINAFVENWCGCNPPSDQTFGDQCHKCNRFKAEAIGINGLAYQYTWSKATQTYAWVPYKLQWLIDTERVHVHEHEERLPHDDEIYDAIYQASLRAALENPCGQPRVFLSVGFSWPFPPAQAARDAVASAADGTIPAAQAPWPSTAAQHAEDLAERHTHIHKLCLCDMPGGNCGRNHEPCEMVEYEQSSIKFCSVCQKRPPCRDRDRSN
ncbi:hypothetical protein QBC36DRAFT_312238 [Triangularia setosa]|uniref:Uncharacterized protein n=1 Tax=Triangularia setosa TaxID=2587417 RepID=A0AAN6W7Z2_9PEZI|nr:hypothetical protein QBC36DRAFT_312238 [Podospora setosa]